MRSHCRKLIKIESIFIFVRSMIMIIKIKTTKSIKINHVYMIEFIFSESASILSQSIKNRNEKKTSRFEMR
jgi:hypothetical protein